VPTSPCGRAPVNSREQAISQRAAPQTVLVVDDDPELRVVLSEYIRLQGFHVLEAKDGLEALLQVKRTRPHAIILDLAMPRLGGIDALKRIVEFDPAITVVVVTGETDTDLHRQASLLGVRAVLAKPVALPDLLAALTGSNTSRAGTVPTTEPDPGTAPRFAPRGGSQGRVLVVDDDSDMREMLSEFATLKGYIVRGVSSGADALRAVVEDIEMPGLSGADP